MLGIGTIARLAGVSVRTLRYYDEVGLLRPVWVDPNTGYRWYAPYQVRRLHRIIAMRDLGVRLAEIALLLDDELSSEELRGILLLRRAEAHDRMAAEADRLTRVEARLAQMEEPAMAPYDVVVKATEPAWALTVTEEVPGVDEIGAAHARMWPRVHRALDDLGIERTAPSFAVEVGTAPIQFTVALPVPETTTVHNSHASTVELAGLTRAATTVIHGDGFNAGFDALRTWIRNAGEREAGELREIYLDCDGPRDTWVVELQLALQPPST